MFPIRMKRLANGGENAERGDGYRFAPPILRAKLIRKNPSHPCARKAEFVEAFQSDLPCLVPLSKIFLFTFDPNHLRIPSHPVPREGRIMIVTNVGRDAVDAAALSREGSQGGFSSFLGSVSNQPARRRTALKRLRQNSSDRTRSAESSGARKLRTAKPCGPGTRCWCQVGGGDVIPTGSGFTLIR
jgi:hypothetical protein